MKVKNTAGRPLEVDGGRFVGAGELADVNSRDPQVAGLLSHGRLTRTSTTTQKEASDD